MATAFVTIAQAATTAPLNPNYREDEFAFYLEDLNAKAIVLEAGYEGAALAAAQRAGLTIMRLHADEKVAGKFDLVSETSAEPARENLPQAQDVALILHTSGTTSRPKIVPLLHANITASAHHIAASLDLTLGIGV